MHRGLKPWVVNGEEIDQLDIRLILMTLIVDA